MVRASNMICPSRPLLASGRYSAIRAPAVTVVGRQARSCRSSLQSPLHETASSSHSVRRLLLPTNPNSTRQNWRKPPIQITARNERVQRVQTERKIEELPQVQEGGGALSSRRSWVQLAAATAALGLLCPAASTSPAHAAGSLVKLKNVENRELQEALRAAVVGDLTTAERLFTELLAKDPESASLWSNRGSVRLSLERFQEAAADFTRAVELAPSAPVPLLNRGIAYEALGRYDDAIADCKAAIENDPEEYAAWFNLGNVDALMGDFGSAFKAYERAALLAPGIAGYRLREALMLFQLDRAAEAQRMMEALVRKYPSYAEAHASLAAVLWHGGRRGDAEGQFSQASQQQPKFSDIRWVKSNLQWPPAMQEAMERFLTIV